MVSAIRGAARHRFPRRQAPKIASAGATAIMIQNDETSAATMSNARRESPRSTSAKLVFHRVGNQYFLAEVWKSSDAEGMIVPASNQEKELAKE